MMKGGSMKSWILLGTVLAVFGGVRSAEAQAPPPRASSSGQPAAQAQSSPTPSAPATSSQRRDPFRSPIVRQAVTAPVCTQPGKGSLLIGQLQLQGIARSVDGQWIAVVDNNTKRAYFLREKDTLCNGVVTRITEDSVVFEERTTDSFGRSQTRQVVRRVTG